MKSESRTNWCRHHRSPKALEHECALGVDINAILPRKTFGYHYAMPCNTATSDGTPKCVCGKRDLFTPAEVAQQDADSEASVAEATKRLLATLPLMEEIKNNHRHQDAAGQVDCPVCGTGKVSYRHAAYNNHVAMRCSTQDCIAFIE